MGGGAVIVGRRRAPTAALPSADAAPPTAPAAPSRATAPARASPARRRRPPRIVVLGDLMVDVVLAPARPLETGTDVPGRVALVAGGSAANTARWLGRLGARSSLIGAVGRDAAGRALVETLRDGQGHAASHARRRGADRPDRGPRLARRRALVRRGPGRRGPAPPGRPASRLVRRRRRRSTCRRTRCSASRSGPAGRRAVGAGSRGRGARQRRPRLDRAVARAGPAGRARRSSARSRRTSSSPPPARPRRSSGRYAVEGLLEFAPIAVVKRGAKGATVLARRRRGAAPLRGRDRARRRGRHDRRRRRVRCRVPGRLVRGPRGGALAAGLAPAGGAGRPSRRDAAAGGAARRSCRSADRRSGRTSGAQVAVEPVEHPGLAVDPSVRSAGRWRRRGTPPGRGRTRRSGRGGAGR